MTRRERGKGGGRKKAAGRDPARAASPRSVGAERPRLFGFGMVNLILLAAALAVIVVGYVLLDRGSVTAAPVLLVLGYVVLIPAGLLIGSRRSGG